ncbi:MAG: L-fucose/L-arabinose isomerase family protein [Planctomycetota bacterium]|jgi:L-fucose isomerase-like protein
MAAKLANAPTVKLALVGVSRDCFPIELTRNRLKALAKACRARGLKIVALKTIIESEKDTLAALAEAYDAGCNAAVIYLGNFGPEGPLAIFAENFPGPVMACAAAEETGQDLIQGRGDAFCGMLNASINFSLRGVPVYIPQRPVGLPEQLAERIEHFQTVARVLLGVGGVKIFAFGPRPQDFYACNAPLAQLYDLGVEVMENSELDMLQIYDAVNEKAPAVRRTAADMARELGKGNTYPDLLPKLARFEVALRRFAGENLGSRQYAIFANKCWPAFEKAFGFVPCFVNSRLSTRGMPVACEVDIYGAFSEYLCYLASGSPATLLDVNNTVPADMITKKTDLKGAKAEDLFMGFHCGNTPSCHLKECSIKYQLIMNRLMEDPKAEPDITRGTLEGRIAPGPITFFRLQGRADGALVSYVAEGSVLDIPPRSFGCIGVFAIPDFARFYRHVLVGKCFPHHGAVAFGHCGKALFDAVAMMGVTDVSTPLPAGERYAGENPFEGA